MIVCFHGLFSYEYVYCSLNNIVYVNILSFDNLFLVLYHFGGFGWFFCAE